MLKIKKILFATATLFCVPLAVEVECTSEEGETTMGTNPKTERQQVTSEKSKEEIDRAERYLEALRQQVTSEKSKEEIDRAERYLKALRRGTVKKSKAQLDQKKRYLEYLRQQGFENPKEQLDREEKYLKSLREGTRPGDGEMISLYNYPSRR
jgi:hypothetical protein